eukprot:scaffold48_cov311-Pinguiococcus_pyrenoidosus.AAC.164
MARRGPQKRKCGRKSYDQATRMREIVTVQAGILGRNLKEKKRRDEVYAGPGLRHGPVPVACLRYRGLT